MERHSSLNTYGEEEEVSTIIPDDTMKLDYRPSTENHYNILRQISSITNQSDHLSEEDNRIPELNVEADTKSNWSFSAPVENQKVFSLSVDGSDHSEFAFNILLKEFLGSNKLLMNYVYDSSLEEILNYRNRRDTIINKYTTLAVSNIKQEQYQFNDFYKNDESTLEIILKSSIKFRSDYFFCGWNGLKGPRGDNKELARNVDFLLTKWSLPTVIIKEQNFRMAKRSKGYKWLFAFDRLSSDCWKIIEVFLHLFNPSLDEIHLFTLLPQYIYVDDYKKKYFSELELLGVPFEYITYECESYEKNYSEKIIEKVNFAERPYYDFLVFFNNSNSSKEKKKEARNMLMKAACNICFLPKEYLYN